MIRAGLSLLAATLLAAGSAAAESCSKDWVCVEGVERPGGVDLIATNLQPWPLTLSLRVEDSDFEAAPGDEVTLSLAGHERRTAIVLSTGPATRRAQYRFSYDWTVGRRDAVHDDSTLYRLPHADDASYRLLQGYGSRFSHTGLEEYTIDFDMPVGTPVHAARAGTVVRTRYHNDQSCWDTACGRYANFIVVLHDDGTTGEYYHLRRDGVLVVPGETVVPGQHIGYSGNTGRSTMPHLHFGVYRASAWGKTQSVPVRFSTRDGVVEKPLAGKRYRQP